MSWPLCTPGVLGWAFAEGKVQVPLGDERLKGLIPDRFWLPAEQLRQEAQRGEPTLAELQHGIDQHLAVHLAFSSGR
jgi:hypothetical protein